MKTLTSADAKKLALKILTEINPLDQREFLVVHSEKVGQVAKLIAQKLNIRSEVFEIAGWVHDIGDSKNSGTHANLAIPILKELGYEVDEILKDCILNHGNEGKPKTAEGKIFQLADKFSIFDLDVIKIILKHGTFPLKAEDIAFLKMMTDKSFELLKQFSD